MVQFEFQSGEKADELRHVFFLVKLYSLGKSVAIAMYVASLGL